MLTKFSKQLLQGVSNMNVFVVDDSEPAREFLRSVLSHVPGLTIAGYARDEQEAIEKIGILQPDIVTLDLNLHSGSGLAVLRHVNKCHPAMRIIVLTNFIDDFFAKVCKDAGAEQVLDKISEMHKVANLIWSWSDVRGRQEQVVQSAAPTQQSIDPAAYVEVH